MGLLDRLLGREPRGQQNQTPNQGGRPWYESGTTATQPGRAGYAEAPRRRGPQSEDERAIARYRYMLRTAPPETIEQAHAEAFAQLTPEQRQMVLNDLQQEMPASERAQNMQTDPQSLARTATRAEMRQPGTVERALGRNGGQQGGGMGMGSLIGGSLLGSVAGVVIGSAIANTFFNDAGYSDETGEGSEAGSDDTASQDGGDTGDAGADGGDAGDAGADSGGDFGGDAGGDFGGGDFGGGDFGGGDFGGGEF